MLDAHKHRPIAPTLLYWFHTYITASYYFFSDCCCCIVFCNLIQFSELNYLYQGASSRACSPILNLLLSTLGRHSMHAYDTWARYDTAEQIYNLNTLAVEFATERDRDCGTFQISDTLFHEVLFFGKYKSTDDTIRERYQY